jgi:hypothetical protein
VREWKRWVAVALALVAVGCSFGCSAGPGKPTTLPTLTPTTAAPSASTSPADGKDAIAHVGRLWFELLQAPTSAATADAIDAITTPTCTCRRVSASYRDAAARDESYFGSITVTSFNPFTDGPALGEVVATYNASISGLRTHSGRVLSQSPGRRGVSVVLRLHRGVNGWVINSIEVVRPGTTS